MRLPHRPRPPNSRCVAARCGITTLARMDLNADFLAAVAPHLAGSRAAQQATIIAACGPILKPTLDQYSINTPLRVSHFIGQTMEESAGYSTTREFASGQEYEDRHDLGNVQPGDGPRYKGRGLIQLTGRANYHKMSGEVGQDIEANPLLVEQFPLALIVSCIFWRDRSINAAADADDIVHVTRLINGGTHGLSDRTLFTNKAKRLLAVAS